MASAISLDKDGTELNAQRHALRSLILAYFLNLGFIDQLDEVLYL
jgi:hypothetical protein